MTTVEIESLANFGDAKAVRTSAGPRKLRTAEPTERFWEMWRAHKDAMKGAGLSCGRNKQNQWEICWWLPDTERQEVEIAAVAESRAADADIELPCPAGLAYLPFQKAGIRYAMNREATMIGDSMGLGKTIQAIGVINTDPSIQKVLVVCPASLRLNWAREMRRWLVREMTIGVIGSGSEWSNAQVVIVNYDLVWKLREKIHGVAWDLVVCDESHLMKTPDAQRTKAILGKYDKDPEKALPALQARRRVALTGTPILNRPIEAQPVLGWLDPQEFGNFWRFAKRYANAHQSSYGWDLTGSSHLDELQTRMRSTVLIRRLKEDVLPELPAKRRQVIELPANGCSGVIRKEATAWAEHQARIEELKHAVEVAKLLEDKEAYAKAVEELREGQTAAFTEMAIIRHEVALAKVPYVVAHVQEAAANAPIVLFAHHRDVVDGLVDGLTEAGLRCVRVQGGMADADKQASVDAFQAGNADVFVGNIKAAGVGLTLTQAAHVVFSELDWVPANMTQAEDRCHRIGQTANVLVQHLVLEGSLDQVMAEALVRKQDIADAALDDPVALAEAKEPVTAITVKDQPVSTAKAEREYSDYEIASLLTQLGFLATVCDGARQIDGMGFNKLDSRFGKALAAQATLTQRQAAVADRLCNKYRRQLEGVGLREKAVAA